MKATVKVSGVDPHNLGRRCIDYCKAELAGIPHIPDAIERHKLAEKLHRQFLGTLPVSVIASTHVSIIIDL